MSGYAAREARINQERKPRVNLCGDCGVEVSDTELLCEKCDRLERTGWESILEQERRTR
jgi:hypothetical protein